MSAPIDHQHRRRAAAAAGFTLIELIVVLAIVALLVSMALPRYVDSLDRGREAALRASLATMRGAIDQYSADKGRYPDSLSELVRQRYLREVPEDPINRNRARWIELTPPADAALAGKLFDVRSGAAGRGQDGRLYADW